MNSVKKISVSASLSHSFRFSSSLVLLASFDFLSRQSLFSLVRLSFAQPAFFPSLPAPDAQRDSSKVSIHHLLHRLQGSRPILCLCLFIRVQPLTFSNPKNNVIDFHVISPYLNDVYTEMMPSTRNIQEAICFILVTFLRNLPENFRLEFKGLKGDIIYEKGQI